MTRLALGAAVGLVVGVVLAAAVGLHAQEIGTAVQCRVGVGCTERVDVLDDVEALASEAGVDPMDLLGAVNTTGLSPRAYLEASGELAVPPPSLPPLALMPPCAWPICGSLGQRIYCVEGIESTHGAHMYNPQPWYGEHAQGWLGFLPSTARRWGAFIGNRWSEWDAAARMIAAGQGQQFYGIAAGICCRDNST